MRHARAGDLERVTELLSQLREIDGLRERSPGSFYRGSRAFLHFHEHDGEIICDVRIDGTDFERRTITTRSAQRDLVTDVRRALG